MPYWVVSSVEEECVRQPQILPHKAKSVTYPYIARVILPPYRRMLRLAANSLSRVPHLRDIDRGRPVLQLATAVAAVLSANPGQVRGSSPDGIQGQNLEPKRLTRAKTKNATNQEDEKQGAFKKKKTRDTKPKPKQET